MAPKRKSDTLEPLDPSHPKTFQTTPERALKRPRASDTTDVSISSSSKDEVSSKPRSWKDVKLEGEDEVRSPISFQLFHELI
jgi:hypothetical protein